MKSLGTKILEYALAILLLPLFPIALLIILFSPVDASYDDDLYEDDFSLFLKKRG